MYVSVEWLLENNVSLLFACVIAVRKVDTKQNVMRHNYFFFGGGHLYFGNTILSLNKILNLTGYEPMS